MSNLVLVLGSSGQLGREIKEVYQYYENLTFYFADRKEIDINDPDLTSLIDYHLPKIVINCAAYTAVDTAENDNSSAFATNSKAVKNLAQACKNCRATLIHISSDYVYHIEKKGPLLESDPCLPQGVYAKSKLEGEKNIRENLDQHIIIRTSWLYSSFGNNFVKTMLRLSDSKSTLNIVDDQIGAPTYAADLAQTLCEISNHVIDLDYQEKSTFGTYNFANEGLTTWYHFAQEIFNLSGIKISLFPTTSEQFNAPAPRPLWSVMSKQKIKSTFNLEIAHWREALQRMLHKLKE